MAKAVLVMDMPHDCLMCKFLDLDERCHAVDVENPWSTDPEKAKPDWCPLRELPEKKTGNSYMNSKEKGIVEGWNAFLDAIEEGAHE